MQTVSVILNLCVGCNSSCSISLVACVCPHGQTISPGLVIKRLRLKRKAQRSEPYDYKWYNVASRNNVRLI